MSADRHGRAALARALAEGRRVVLVSIAQAAGSTPREAGAAMVVDDQGFTGTIGGGHLEFEALRLAREALVGGAPAGTWIVRFPLAARVGQCCGGVATLAFSTFDADDASWLDAVAACERSGAACAIATRIAAGAGRIVVTADSARGSLGDAVLDAAAITAARQRLARDGTGIVAAGDATLVIDVVRPDPFFVVLFGNGHVGRALVTILGTLPASVRWVDERADDFPASVPANVEIVVTDAPEDEVRGAPRGAYVIVMTHSHALDYDLVTAALARDDWRYLGLIGSKSKRQQFARRLAARGLPDDALNRVTCPIGGQGPKSKEPGVIAVAVAAELLTLREAASAHDLVRTTARRPA
jgi:xanthine dehydrogenase accessory factor